MFSSKIEYTGIVRKKVSKHANPTNQTSSIEKNLGFIFLQISYEMFCIEGAQSIHLVMCVLVSHENYRTIKHLFFQCKVARSIWSAIQIVSNLYASRSVANIFGNWLHGVDRKDRTIIRVGVLAVIWSLWLFRNDKVFNDKNTSLLQVLYRCTSLLRSWSTLQCVKNQDLFMVVSARLELIARDIFIRHGWPRYLRLGPP